MFEEKKEKALRTITKKDKKVEEYRSLLEEEITPKLNKLRDDKRAWKAYQRTCDELEHIARTLRAFEWKDATDRAAGKDESIAQAKKEKKMLEDRKKQYAKEIKASEGSNAPPSRTCTVFRGPCARASPVMRLILRGNFSHDAPLMICWKRPEPANLSWK